MRINTLLKLTAAAICLAGAIGAHAAGDPQAGKFKFSTCSGCHAIPGYTNAYPTYHVPKLGGQHPEYVVAALQGYKTGDREHKTMHANAATLSDADMADIAAYVSETKPQEYDRRIAGNPEAGKQKLDSLKSDAAAYCATCHGENGNSQVPSFPRLAGQYEDYLLQALMEYQSGGRKNPIMKGVVAKLSPEDMANMAAYYASQESVLGAIHYSGH